MGGGVLIQHALLPSLHHSQRGSLGRKTSLAVRKGAYVTALRAPAQSGASHVTLAGWRWADEDDHGDDDNDVSRDAVSFEDGVALFNRGEYYQCHDVMESIWMKSPEPKRTVLHAILQCSVGLYHLLNQNHRGAMTEIGEALAKLRRQRFMTGPFFNFEQEVSALLDYIYNTQLEYAACTEDLCITMDGSKESYRLLGNFGAGQHLYDICKAENDNLYICFKIPYSSNLPSTDFSTAYAKVKVPILNTTGEDFCRL